MDSGTAKASGVSRIRDMVVEAAGHEELIKAVGDRFKDNPEKLRALLNLLFIPRFEPTFNVAPEQLDHLSKDVLAPFADSKPSSFPKHMFNIDTMNLIDYPSIGAAGRYCIVSHSWKGSEIEYYHISEAKSWALKSAEDIVTKELEQAKTAPAGTSRSDLKARVEARSKVAGKNDVQKIKDKCTYDLHRQQVLLELLAEDVLDEFGLSKSTCGDIAGALVEKRSFGTRLVPGSEGYDPESNQAFNKYHHVREAADEMISCLQRWKSAIKIEESIRCAKEIFGRRILDGSETGNRYVWLDTCCINKSNSSEYVEAISLMGDWYAFAEFCLVHLDTRDKLEKCDEHSNISKEECVPTCKRYKDREAAAREWSLEWRLFKESDGDATKETTKREPNITEFADIRRHRPQWSERGWTLQELILSKTTFYVNSAWMPLSRPVEYLGSYYYLCPFIGLYAPAEPLLQGFWGLERLKNCMEKGNLKPWDRDGSGLQGDSKGHATRIEVAWNLAIVLKGLGFTMPTDLDKESAVPLITANVREASESQAGPNDALRQGLQAYILEHSNDVLEHLRFTVPTDLDKETAFLLVTAIVKSTTAARANSNIASLQKLQASVIERTSNNLAPLGLMVSTNADQKPDVVLITATVLPKSEARAGGNDIRTRRQIATAKSVIDFLLKCLVTGTTELIRKDRTDIANFSNIYGLDSWLEGTVRTRFAADKVMSLARKRNVTVEVDQAYSLMGVCGVRFPMFQAEGLAKALTRLLDEVVISYNDVSVFNWAGKDHGSPIRGRSLYPSSLKAFGAQEPGEGLQQQRDNKNKKLARQVNRRRTDLKKAYDVTFDMLRKAINFIKKKEAKEVPIGWVQGIILFVQAARLNALHRQALNIAKILKYIQEHSANIPPPGPEPSESSKMLDKSGTGFGSGLSLPLVTRPSFSMTPSFTKSKTSGPDTSSTAASSPPLKMGLTGLKPSFGSKFGKKDKGSGPMPTTPPVDKEPATPPPTLSAADTMVDEAPQNALAVTSAERTAWESLDAAVRKYIDDITPEFAKEDDYDEDDDEDDDIDDEDDDQDEEDGSALPTPKASLPPAVQDMEVDIGTQGNEKKTRSWEAGGSMISPNPIIVNNSGIESSFDIQRVIITMTDLPGLRQAVKTASSPQQKFKGECTISTGFAMVKVEFMCEAHILEKQLNVAEVMETKILKPRWKSQKEKEEVEELEPPAPGAVAKSAAKEGGDGDAAEPPKPAAADPEANAARDEADDQEDSSQIRHRTAKEDIASRMIEYIEEPQLVSVAGEWVLARFSGVHDAKWFLCQLELGSTHELYGHRVPSSEINFDVNAIPEPVLFNVWRTYMRRKKRKLCKILGNYIASKDLTSGGTEARKEAFKVGSEMMRGGAKMLKGLAAPGEEGVTAGGNLILEQIDRVLEDGLEATKSLGGSLLFGLLGKILEMHADRLEEKLSASVLKRTPKALRPAIERLNDNGDWLPAMFHSAKRVHMF